MSAGETQRNMDAKECGKMDSTDICFTDTTAYFDHLIKTTNPLAQQGGTMESITSLKRPVAEAKIKANKKVSSVCTVTNKAIYSF